MATAGLLINLLLPKLEFKHPAAVVKQSASAFVAFLAEFAVVAIPVLLYKFARLASVSCELYAACVALVLLLMTAALWQVIRTTGARRFEQLTI
jgi:hypothetical protein